jgi:branched-chain amino acid transport system substrate-binding protein
MERLTRLRVFGTAGLACLLATSACASRVDERPVAAVGESSAAEQSLPAATEVPTAEIPTDTGATTADAAAPASGGAATSSAGNAAAAAGSAPAGSAASPRTRATGAAGSAAPASPTAGQAAAANSPSESKPGNASAPGAPGQPGGPPDAVRVQGAHSQGVTDTEIRLGVLAPLSGIAGFIGQLEVDAIRAYLSDVNSKGGVYNRKFRIIAADTRLEPSTEASAARRLVEQDKVFALISPFADSIAGYVTAKGIPTATMGLLPAAYSSKYPNVYPVGLNVVDTAPVLATKLVRELKVPIKTTAIAYDTANVAWGPWVEYAKRAWEAVGVKVVSLDRFNVSDGDCTSLVLKMKDLNVDFWNHAYTAGWPLCEQAMTRQNWRPKYGRGGAYTDDINFAGQVGKSAHDLYSITNTVQVTKNKGTPYPWHPSGVAPAVDDYITTMQKYSPRSGGEAGLEGIWAQTFWVAAKLLHQAILRQTEALTWSGTNQWISRQSKWDNGLLAPINFTPTCKTGSTPEYIFQFKWDESKQRLTEADWQAYGPPRAIPDDVRDAMVPGAGPCFLTALADAKL